MNNSALAVKVVKERKSMCATMTGEFDARKVSRSVNGENDSLEAANATIQTQ